MLTSKKGACITSSLTSAILSLSISQPSSAQILEEVTVTAQKREQNLSDVGISVSAFSGDQMKELGLTNTDQIDAQVPGLIVTSFGGGTTTVFNIRGSGQLDFADQQEAPVAVYSDGVYNSYLGGVGFSFFDLERVEVLRGSQGTLFGRNATGGLVHIISRKPQLEPDGYLEFTAGEYGQRRVEGAVGGGLTPTISGRLSFAHERGDGYIDNRAASNDGPEIDNNSLRAQLFFEPTDATSVLLSARYSKDDTTGQIYHTRPVGTDGNGFTINVPQGSAAHNAFCLSEYGLPSGGGVDCTSLLAPNAEPDSDPFDVANDEPGRFEREQSGFTITLEHDFDAFQLTSISDYQSFKKDYWEDTDGTASFNFHFGQTVDSNAFSQELRLQGESDNLRWQTGLYYLNIDSDYTSTTDSINWFGLLFDNEYTLETTTYGVFGQVEYDFSDEWTLIAGLRWTEDEKEFEFIPGVGFTHNPADADAATAALLFSGLVGGDGLPKTTEDDGDWSGNLEINWRPGDSTLVYAKVSRGHKAGGFNGGAVAGYTAADVIYDSELPVTYEAGIKTAVFDQSLRINASLFYTDYKDFQTYQQTGLDLRLFNVDAEITGAEIELIANPMEGLEMLFGASLLDADQLDVPGPDGIQDRPMPNAPDLSLNGLVRYEWDAFDGSMAVQLDFNWVDERSLNAIDAPALTGDDYFVANAKLGFTSSEEKWHAEVWVKNLNDEEYFPTVFDLAATTGSTISVPAPPRWFGATIRYSW